MGGIVGGVIGGIVAAAFIAVGGVFTYRYMKEKNSMIYLVFLVSFFNYKFLILVKQNVKPAVKKTNSGAKILDDEEHTDQKHTEMVTIPREKSQLNLPREKSNVNDLFVNREQTGVSISAVKVTQ